jgi:hypothetical protein
MEFSENLNKRVAFVGLWALIILTAVLSSAAADRVATPTPALLISPKGGVFSSNVSVTLSAATKEIRYTTDGSEPGTNSPLYTAPLGLTNSLVLKARVFLSPTDAGEIAAEAFTFIDTNVVEFSSTLPLVVISTFGSAIPAPTNAALWMQVFDAPANQRATLTNAVEFSGPVRLKPRGFTSLRYPKRSYSVETLDAAGDESPVPLLGMPADHDWVLYAPYPDKTLLRDVLAYELSNKLGHYAARTRFVEMFINDSTNRLARGHYAGVYVLEEKVKISPNRVAIHKMKPDDNSEPNVTGGYLFKKDHLEKVGVETAEVPVRSKPAPLYGRLPTGPGGFPASAAGFLPPADPPAFSNAVSIVTNTVPSTNGDTAAVTTVTVVRTNTTIVATSITLTNSTVATNYAVTTNFPVTTNVAISSKTVIATNPVVATQAVAGTNTVAMTNQVDANTAVVTTTMAITTTSTYRTNLVVSTNSFAVTNVNVITNVVLATNSVLATNVAIGTVAVITTNSTLATNIFTIGSSEPAPGSAKLVSSGEGFVTSRANSFFFVEPKPAKITTAQRAWLTNYLNRFEQALCGPDFRNPTNGYAAFIDVDSFIDQHLFVEATKNIDGFRFSTYFTKDRGGKLKMDPVWDWNLSFGNARGKQGYMAEHWYWPQLNDQQYSWFRRLFEDSDFGQRYVDRWAQWRTNVFATSNLIARVDALAATLKEPAARNFERWPILGSIVEPEYFAGKTWDEDIQYMKTWITNHLAWMDAQFVPAPVVSQAANVPAPTNAVSFSAPTGQVYFTVDGSDPRVTNGNVSSAAKAYHAPVAVKKPTTIVARAKSAAGWSSPVAVKVQE